jgi:hypothetical protein
MEGGSVWSFAQGRVEEGICGYDSSEVKRATGGYCGIGSGGANGGYSSKGAGTLVVVPVGVPTAAAADRGRRCLRQCLWGCSSLSRRRAIRPEGGARGGHGGSLNGGEGRGQAGRGDTGGYRSDGNGVNSTECARLVETSRGSALAYER